MKRLTILLAAMAALMLVPAAQAFAAGTVTVIPLGEGSGEVDSTTGNQGQGYWFGNPVVECAYDGESEEASGNCESELTVSAGKGGEGLGLRQAASKGSEFTEWSVEINAGSPVVAYCNKEEYKYPYCSIFSVTVGGFSGGEATVYALFEPCEEGSEAESCEEPVAEQPLTTHIYQGEGTIVSNPAGLECTGTAGQECTAEFAENEEVTLTASPAAGYRTWYWENCPSPEGHRCTVTMDEAKDVGVLFLRQYEVNISKSAGSEPGLVLLYPAPNGVGCDYNCTDATYNYPEGEAVTLAAYEYPGNHLHLKEFTGGTGDAAVCNGETECSFSVTGENSGVEAVFVKDAQNTLSIEKQGGGLAFIKSYNGIYCSDYCSGSSADYYSGEEVEVSWTLAAGTKSIEWSTGAGTCTGSSEETEGSCSVTMSAAKELVATLE